MSFTHLNRLIATVFLCSSFAWSYPSGQEENPTKRHFVFIDYEFIFTVELVRQGTPILNFINLGTGDYHLQADNVRIISGIKLYRPRLFDVETAINKDLLRVGAINIHPRSSFGVTLVGELGPVTEIDRLTIEIERERFELESISSAAFDTLSIKVNRLNLLSPDIREDFRVLEIRPTGRRSRRAP